MLVLPNKAGGNKNSPNQDRQEDHQGISRDDLFGFLKTRQNKLQAVVITGGEPTLHSDLPDFIKEIRQLGFLIKLDTNGTNPDMILDLVKKKMVEYIAMDINGPEEKYGKITGVKSDFKKIEKSVKIIKESGLEYEFRTTLVPELHSIEDIARIGRIIKGADKWYLQKFSSDNELIDFEATGAKSFSHAEMEVMAEQGRDYVKICQYR
jgi:pyruvate formate lyase activating enzyme